MNAQKTQRVQLLIEELEPRYAPAYLVADPGAWSVAGLRFPGLDDGWNVQCRINMASNSYFAPDGLPQIAVLHDYGEILGPLQSPNEQDYQLLVNEFPDWNFSESPLQLADNSIQIKDYEALAAGSGAPAGDVGASLLLRYNPTGVDPTQIDWIQFVSTNAPLGSDPPLIIDNAGANGMSPFYNRGGGTASDTGFVDIPSRFIQNNPIEWHADLFVAQEVPNPGGPTTVVIWGGVSWGWQTVPLKAPSLVLVSSTGVSPDGTSATLTANVSSESADGSPPTGTVDFYSDGVLLGTGTLDDSGMASFDETGLTVGTHDILAVYSGDGKFTSGSASTSQVVTDSTNPVATDSTNPVATDSTNPVVTDSTNQALTDSTSLVVADSTNQALTDSTSLVVTNAANPVVTDSTSLVVTNAANPVVTDSTNLVVTNAINSVVTDAINPVVTDSTNLVVTNAITPVVTDSTDPMVTNAMTPVVTDSTDPMVTNATNPVVTDSTNPVVMYSTSQELSPVVTLLNPGDQIHPAGDAVNLSLMASASNGNPLTYSATALPPGLSITDGTISGVIDPSTVSPTEYSVAVTAMDAQGNSDTQCFSWTVS
jgi:hypothetical protein